MIKAAQCVVWNMDKTRKENIPLIIDRLVDTL